MSLIRGDLMHGVPQQSRGQGRLMKLKELELHQQDVFY